MSLLSLPIELIEEIGSFLNADKDYAALSRTSRLLHRVVLPHLYKFNHAGGQYRETAEHWAIENGRVEVLQRVYDFGLLSTASHIFHDAVQAGHASVVGFLFKYSTCENKPAMDKLIHLAARNVELLRYFLEQGVSANARNDFGDPLLSTATTDTMQVLVEHGADVNMRGHDGIAPLMRVAHDNTIDMAKILIDHGADVNVRNLENDRTALHQAARMGDTETMRLLMSSGADPYLQDSHGKTALHYAAAHNKTPAVKVLSTPSCLSSNEMLDKVMGWTPLHEAVISGHTDAVQFFLESKCVWLDQQDVNGRSPLFYAAKYGRLEILNSLLAHGSDSDTKDKYGATPMFVAVRNEKKDIALRLLEQNSDCLKIRDDFGHSMIWWASSCGYSEVLAVLTEHAEKVGHEIDSKELEAPKAIIKNNLQWCWCDICTRPIGGCRTGLMCTICCAGHFVICWNCFVDGTLSCKPSHRVEKWVPYDSCTCPIFTVP